MPVGAGPAYWRILVEQEQRVVQLERVEPPVSAWLSVQSAVQGPLRPVQAVQTAWKPEKMPRPPSLAV